MITLNDTSVKGRIKPGALCMLDDEFFYWPNVPLHQRPVDFAEDMVFNIVPMIRARQCWADGSGGEVFGRPGQYGNGAILIYNQQDIEAIQ